MMGLSIAHHIRLQVCFTEDIFSPYPEFREFNVEDSRKDYGEKNCNCIGGKKIIMNLIETITLMISDSYKDRFF
ncbi:MAG: hypothetical protein L6V81_11150 [Clostridium sp.]|nr:MAG: hypothetical protein L6V81_11150 [Clostridium sp.]